VNGCNKISPLAAVSPSEPRGADDPAGEGYDWAVVSGGQPTIPSGLDDGRLSRPKCKNGEGTNGSGLWWGCTSRIQLRSVHVGSNPRGCTQLGKAPGFKP
jgi:hypothetical protein